MRYLIDTHVLIWYLDGSEKLSQKIRDELNNESHTVMVSVASLWEIAIKLSKNKTKLDFNITLHEVEAHIIERDYTLLNIAFKHLNAIAALPAYHDDPFDRLIIAQAISENLTLISVDKHFSAYPVDLIS